MKSKLLIILIITTIAFLDLPNVFSQELTKEQWQQEMSQFKAKRDELKSKLDKFKNDVNSLQDAAKKHDADLIACNDDILKLLGVTQAEYDAFLSELKNYENRTTEIMRLSDEELLKYSGEVEKMNNRVNEMAKHKIAFVDLDEQIEIDGKSFQVMPLSGTKQAVLERDSPVCLALPIPAPVCPKWKAQTGDYVLAQQRSTPDPDAPRWIVVGQDQVHFGQFARQPDDSLHFHSLHPTRIIGGTGDFSGYYRPVAFLKPI